MPFRRDHDDTPGSSRWRIKHRAQLIQCGIPETIVESDRALRYVLLHGDDELGTGWNPSWLSRREAGALLTFLRDHIPDPLGYDLFRTLEQRLTQNE